MILCFLNIVRLKPEGHVPFEISRYLFYAIAHGCKFEVVVQDTKHVKSPLTQGGLEIKSWVAVEWDVNSKNKFVILKEYIENFYSFDKSCADESAVIIEGIKRLLDEPSGQKDDEDDIDTPIQMHVESDEEQWNILFNDLFYDILHFVIFPDISNLHYNYG